MKSPELNREEFIKLLRQFMGCKVQYFIDGGSGQKDVFIGFDIINNQYTLHFENNSIKTNDVNEISHTSHTGRTDIWLYGDPEVNRFNFESEYQL